MAEQKRYPTTAELDLEARQQEDYVSPLRIDGGSGVVTEDQAAYAVEGNDTSQYIGVSPEYMTYANETEKPLAAEHGAEKVALEELQAAASTEITPATPTEIEQTKGTVGTETVTTSLSGSVLQAKVAEPKVEAEPVETEQAEDPAPPATTSQTATPAPAPAPVKATKATATTDGKN